MCVSSKHPTYTPENAALPVQKKADGPAGPAAVQTCRNRKLIFTQFVEHLPLQVRDLPGGLVQGAAEPHLGPEQLQAVSDHVVHVDGERVILGPNIQALFPPDVPLHTEASCDWLDT